MNNNNSKSDRSTRKIIAKSDREYVRGTIHNLSLSRWTDQEIVDYLRDEKQIEIARSTVNSIKNQIDKQAEKWYIELRESRYKYVASYKERIDSLFSYQKKLNQIIDFYMQPGQILYSDTIVRAIAELHKIEISIFNLFKQLPDLGLEQDVNQDNPSHYISAGCTCAANGHDIISDCKCRTCLTVWCPTTLKQDWCPNPECSGGTKGCPFQPYDEHYVWIKCVTCARWFKTQKILDVHNSINHLNPLAIHDFDSDEDLNEYLEEERIETRKRLESDKE
jgi:hypothetical protein